MIYAGIIPIFGQYFLRKLNQIYWYPNGRNSCEAALSTANHSMSKRPMQNAHAKNMVPEVAPNSNVRLLDEQSIRQAAPVIYPKPVI
jgi:hypothetical protein